MRRALFLLFVLVLLVFAAVVASQEGEALRFGRFGAVTLSRHSPHPAHVVLLVSGDEGATQSVVDIARELSSLDALVVGIDVTHYSRELETSEEWCSYPGGDVDFEFHLTDWLTDSSSKTARPVLPEVEKLQGRKILCFYGSEETDSLCKNLAPNLAKGVLLKGGHHFDGNYEAMAETILREANTLVR